MASETNGQNPMKRKASKTIGTHSGTFHCDEVLACFMLKQLSEYENARILRSRNNDELKSECDIIVDVGGEFDHGKKLYDHHQKTFQETLSTLRPDLGNEFNIRLSSAGLIYCYYGENIINSILKKCKGISLSPNDLIIVYKQIYRGLISEIDAIDNGVPIVASGEETLYKISTHLSARIGRFNPSWDEDKLAKNIEEKFHMAVDAAGQEFIQKVLDIGGSWIKARQYVEQALKGATTVYDTGEILLLERFCPWKAHLADLEKQYKVEGIPKLVIFQENETSWRVAGVPISPESFLGRKFLPTSWRGLADEELSRVAGIADLVFVHHTGFIGGAKTKEAAVSMAIKSVQWEN